MNPGLRLLFHAALMAALVPAGWASPKTRSYSAPDDPAARIKRVENGIPPLTLSDSEPPLHLDLEMLMRAYKVPAVSIAVIDNFKVAWAKGYGVTESGGSTRVTPHTLFQAASISKPVSAAGTLYLVEHGRLSLDEDVNRELKSWHVPGNEFTSEQKVTLRRIMSHSAGLTVHGFSGYEVGAPVPTLQQILDGQPPANTAPVRVEYVPGTKEQYSGGGVEIEQQVVIDVTGRPFPQFMRETVLDKIGMSDSTYQQPLPPALASRAATATDVNGKSIPGRWHVYPEMAAAGLWTTPTDLAKFAIETALSKQGKANHILSQAMAQEMLKPQSDPVGLGFFVREFKNPEEFGHSGSNAGFRSWLVMFADSGKGVVVMANSDNGMPIEMAIIRSVAAEYGWDYRPDPPMASEVLMLIAELKGPQAALARYSELKKSNPSGYMLDENTLVGLGYHFLMAGHTDAAIHAFELEVRDYPDFWNACDSLAEAYQHAGQKELAIRNYKRSLELNPKNQNGIDHLKVLQSAN